MFDETRLFVGIVCGKDGKKAFEELGRNINILGSKMMKDPEAYVEGREEFIRNILLAKRYSKRIRGGARQVPIQQNSAAPNLTDEPLQ